MKRRIGLGACLVTGIVACSEPVLPDIPAGATISISPPNAILRPGDTLRLSAEVRDQDGGVVSGLPLRWETQDEGVATVDAGGLLTGVALGNSIVTASVGDAEGSAPVTVGLVVPIRESRISTSAASGQVCALTDAGVAYCWGHRGPRGIDEAPTVVPGGHTFSQVSVTITHACALSTTGRVFCWEQPYFAPASDPTEVSVDGTVVQIAVGTDVTCALLSTGSTRCWGRNSYGQLGRGYTSFGDEGPGPLAGDPSFIQISFGLAYGCGLTALGVVQCWGNRAEIIGPTVTAPVAIGGDLRFLHVDVGAYGACAISLERIAYCWGSHGLSSDTDVPVEVAGATNLIEVSAGSDHACALSESGDVYCWGENRAGLLGNGDLGVTMSNTATLVVGGHDFRSIAAGLNVACGQTSTGVYCWGDNTLGSLGIGSSAYETLPVEVAGNIAWAEVEAGNYFSCGIDSAADLYCWGAGYPLQPGPTPNEWAGTWSNLSVGFDHACALDAMGAAYCWGGNSRGQLGDGTTGDRISPTAVDDDSAFVSIAAGSGITCALTASGQTICWGDLVNAAPAPVGWSLAAISVAYGHACGITGAGVSYCWGNNFLGQLGNGSTISNNSPQLVSGGHVFSAITVGRDHSCGIAAGGNAYCWGRAGSLIGNGEFGDLGLAGGLGRRTVPVMVVGGQTYSRIDAGSEHTCALATNGEVHCWGSNWPGGQLGIGSLVFSPVPVAAQLDPTAIDVSTSVSGDASTCAVLSDGRAFCWGANTSGQVGVPVTLRSATPLPTVPFP